MIVNLLANPTITCTCDVAQGKIGNDSNAEEQNQFKNNNNLKLLLNSFK